MAACPNENLFTGRKKSMKGQFTDVTRHIIDTILWDSQVKRKDVYWKNEYRQILNIHLMKLKWNLTKSMKFIVFKDVNLAGVIWIGAYEKYRARPQRQPNLNRCLVMFLLALELFEIICFSLKQIFIIFAGFFLWTQNTWLPA